MDQERNVLDYIYVLVKWRRMIATSVLSVAVVTAGITLIVSERWTADTTVLPHEEELGRLEQGRDGARRPGCADGDFHGPCCGVRR